MPRPDTRHLISLMPFAASTHRRLLPVAVIVVCTAWAVFYAVAAINDPYGGDEASRFIEPLFLLHLFAALWSAIEALVMPEDSSNQVTQSPNHRLCFGSTGLGDRRRMAIVISLPVMLVLVSLLGFIIGGAIYVGGLCFALDERRSTILLAIVILAIAVIWLFFGTLLGVALPLWPNSAG